MATLLRAIQADITTLKVDAIVNAANSSLLAGAAWTVRSIEPPVRSCCKSAGSWVVARPVKQNSPKLSPACQIRDTHRGPVWHGGSKGEPELLASCYRNSLQLAARKDLHSIAFPGISTGVYGYPVELAAQVAVEAVNSSLPKLVSIREVIFCCFSAGDLAVYQRLLDARP